MPADSPNAAGPPGEILNGVSLEQYAGVTVALAEGFPLEAVLANEQIAPDAWPQVDAAWKARVARDGADGPAFTQLRDKRVVAEDTLARSAAPIDADLAAWMSFLQAYAASKAPFEMLGSAGLGLNDLSRLSRRWSRRLAQDEALQRQAAELAKKGLGPVPPIRVSPPALRLFPWSRGPAAKPVEIRPKVAAPADTSLAPGKMRLYSYVAIKAQLAESPGDEAAVLARLAVQDFATTDASWQVILAGDPELSRDYQRLLASQRAKLKTWTQTDKPGAALAVPPAAPAPPAAEPSTLFAAPALPAAFAPPEAPPPAAPAPDRAMLARLAGTSLAVDVPHKPALPFAEGAAPAPAPPAATPAPAVAAKPRSDMAGTMLALDVPARAAIPFPAPAPPPAPKAAAPALTLEQHAALFCDIAAAPERALETLGRYHLGPDQKRAVDQHYTELFAREPAAKERWESACQTYRAWLASNRVNR